VASLFKRFRLSAASCLMVLVEESAPPAVSSGETAHSSQTISRRKLNFDGTPANVGSFDRVWQRTGLSHRFYLSLFRIWTGQNEMNVFISLLYLIMSIHVLCSTPGRTKVSPTPLNSTQTFPIRLWSCRTITELPKSFCLQPRTDAFTRVRSGGFAFVAMRSRTWKGHLRTSRVRINFWRRVRKPRTGDKTPEGRGRRAGKSASGLIIGQEGSRLAVETLVWVYWSSGDSLLLPGCRDVAQHHLCESQTSRGRKRAGVAVALTLQVSPTQWYSISD